MSELSLAYGADDAQVITQDTVFQGYFRMDALTLRHKRFDGSWTSGIRRELFQRGDAVAVLPWDVEADRVILIEQFRPGAIRGAESPWMLEAIAGVPCQVEVASEFRYRRSVALPGTLVVTISQSGETADTLAAIKHLPDDYALAKLAICNVDHSAIVRASDLVFLTKAGPEIGVASTKAFTTQLAALMVLMACIARRQAKSALDESLVKQAIAELPAAVEATIAQDAKIKSLASHFIQRNHALFLGRGVYHPIAMEGALKLKEISYIHAEAYPAGELKHGPLALVDDKMPIVAVAPKDDLLDKLKSNLEEVRARGGQLFVFADQAVNYESGPGVTVIDVPSVSELAGPIVYTVVLQLLSYHVAVAKGTDIDKPRNLAKSVTVE